MKRFSHCVAQVLMLICAADPLQKPGLTESVRRNQLANARRKVIAAALWRDYLGVLEDRGLQVEAADSRLDLSIDDVNNE